MSKFATSPPARNLGMSPVLDDAYDAAMPDTALPDTARDAMPDDARDAMPDTALPDTARDAMPDDARDVMPDTARDAMLDTALSDDAMLDTSRDTTLPDVPLGVFLDAHITRVTANARDASETVDTIDIEPAFAPARSSSPRYELPDIPEGYVMEGEIAEDFLAYVMPDDARDAMPDTARDAMLDTALPDDAILDTARDTSLPDVPLGVFLDAHIARLTTNAHDASETADTIEIEPAFAPARFSSPRYEFPDIPEGYVMEGEIAEDFLACKDAYDVEKLLLKWKEKTLKARMKYDPKFATSTIFITDKDYELSIDPVIISLVKSDPFHGYESETVVAHLTKLHDIATLFTSEEKIRYYYILKLFPFSLKDDAKAWFTSLAPGYVEQVLKAQNDLLNELNDNSVRVITRGGKMTQEPLYPECHPKRIDQDSQGINTDTPSHSKEKKKDDRNLHASSPNNVTPEEPNDISASDAETQSGDEHELGDNMDSDVHNEAQPSNDEDVEIEPTVNPDNPQPKRYDKNDFAARKHGKEREPWV
ncbi:hypothetical protein ZWY2020_057307 [Hordeum vulgare]|nr:hypothetical protein ZWY2020_057307 [Hordeum vulgare]